MRTMTTRIAVTVAALAGSLAWRTAARAAPAPAPPAPPAPIAASAAAEPPAALSKLPSFELVDRGDSVEVIARNIKAARTAILPVRSRLEVPIVAGPSARRVNPGDATVKLIELDTEDAVRVLSVKLGFERADVKALARFAQAIQVGDDLHVMVPRKLPADGAAAKLPEPTLSPALAAAVARADGKPELQAGPPPAPAPTAARPEPAMPARPEAGPPVDPSLRPALRPALPPAPDPAPGLGPTPAPEPVLGPAPRLAPVPDARPAVPSAAAPRPSSDAARSAAAGPAGERKPLDQALAADTDDRWSKITMYLALGLAAAGAGVWMMRRRRAQLSPTATIEVIAQRSLGGKARIVWLSAGPRELIVAVTGQQVRLLGQWRKTEAAPGRPHELVHPLATDLPAAYTHADTRLDSRDEPADKPVSPAVSGILRLRGRTGQFAIPQPVVDDAVATGDIEADAAWAREILAATGARR